MGGFDSNKRLQDEPAPGGPEVTIAGQRATTLHEGFVRPVRRAYVHTKCGTETRMGLALCETYARDPKFYSGTFCCRCGAHFPVGEDGEFIWVEDGAKVGT